MLRRPGVISVHAHIMMISKASMVMGSMMIQSLVELRHCTSSWCTAAGTFTFYVIVTLRAQIHSTHSLSSQQPCPCCLALSLIALLPPLGHASPHAPMQVPAGPAGGLP